MDTFGTFSFIISVPYELTSLGHAADMSSVFLAAALGLGLASAPSLVAQVAAPQSGATSAQPTAIQPDQRASKEQVTKLVEVMRVREQLQPQLNEISAMKQQQLQNQVRELALKLTGGKALTSEQQAVVDRVTNSYWEKSRDIYSVDGPINDMIVSLQDHLSRSDVEAAIAFYSSPAGQDLENAPLAVSQTVVPAMMKHLNIDKAPADELAKDRIELTRQHLTNADVDGIFAFYSSTTGQHLLNEQPAINSESAQMEGKRILEHNRVLADEMARDKKELSDALAPPGDNPTAK